MRRTKREKVRISKPPKPKYGLAVRNDWKMCTEEQVLWDDFKFALEKSGFPSRMIRKVEREKRIDHTVYSVAIEGVRLEETEVMGDVRETTRRPPYDFTECVVALHNACNNDIRLREKVSKAIHLLDSPDFEKEKEESGIRRLYTKANGYFAFAFSFLTTTPITVVFYDKIFEGVACSTTLLTNKITYVVCSLILGCYCAVKGIKNYMEAKKQEKEFKEKYR
jgi:hypothetical protein